MKTNGSHAKSIVQIHALSKTYNLAPVLNRVDLDIHAGEFVILLGVSGSGKSTLLNLISGIDKADSGHVGIQGVDITRLNEYQRTVFRRDHVGIIFQFFNLISTLTILENVTLPVDLRGDTGRQSRQRGMALLERVGLAGRAADFPDRLSGGEQQRVAIARALIHEPLLVLADEPTGNLDEETGRSVITLLLELTREAGRTLLMATHNSDIIPLADRVLCICDGKLVEQQHIPGSIHLQTS